MSEIMLKADRRRQFWVFLVAVLCSAVSLRVVYEVGQSLKQIRSVAQINPSLAAEQTLLLTDSFLEGIAWFMGLFALYLVVQGLRILKADQYPLPGAKVVLDTRQVYGRPAKRRAFFGLALAVFLSLVALWLPGAGRERIQSVIVLPSEADAKPPEVIDPDQFPSPVPGTALVDPRSPEHPLHPQNSQSESGRSRGSEDGEDGR